MAMVRRRLLIPIVFHVLLSIAVPTTQFSCHPQSRTHDCRLRSGVSLFGAIDDSSNESSISSFETSDASTKGIVSSFTGFVNLLMKASDRENSNSSFERSSTKPPSTPTELMEKIRDDYVVNNYLWSGDVYLPAFEEECKFTDPTISFVGTERFVTNVQNLRPIVDLLIGPDGDCRSDLLQIELNEQEGYVRSRWNMVGELNSLPWKPKIDVIGRTKFWYKNVSEGGVRIYFYDECWEISAGKALMQLITPGGTIPNSSNRN